MVTRRFRSLSELKRISPVSEVRGRIVGGPFTYGDAVRKAGNEVVRKIFRPRFRDYIEPANFGGGGDNKHVSVPYNGPADDPDSEEEIECLN